MTYLYNLRNKTTKLLINKSRFFVLLVSLFLLFQISNSIVHIFNLEERAVIIDDNFTEVLKSDEQVTKTSLLSVSKYHLFGQVINKLENKKKIITAPETKKPLVLLGVFLSEQKNASLAIIQEKKSQAEIVKQGESLNNGTKILAIYSDRVILSLNNKMETLKLKREKANIQIVQDSNVTTKIKSRNIQSVILLYLNNPNKFWKHARLTKAKVSKQEIGYMFSYSDRRLMRDLNVYPRDIVLSVNNISVANTAKIKKLLSNINKTQSVKINLLRNGQKKEITVNLK